MSDGSRKRLEMELRKMKSHPPPGIRARPDPGNYLLWHYCVDGPADTPYSGGQYFGKVRFPPEYPFAPPSIRMTTPSGRFQVDMRLCLSISDYHPKEWNPIWNIETILKGLVSFMVDGTVTAGAVDMPPAARREYAEKSLAFNRRLPAYSLLFPEGDGAGAAPEEVPTASPESANTTSPAEETEETHPVTAAAAGVVNAIPGGAWLSGVFLGSVVIAAMTIAWNFVGVAATSTRNQV